MAAADCQQCFTVDRNHLEVRGMLGIMEAYGEW
jgi:hypothetical protein